jgi:phage terminase small subunit
MAENESLTPKQYKFLSLLLASKTVADAAKEAGIAESTAYRWLNDPMFKQVLEASKSNLFEQGMSALQAKFVNAVQALERNLNAEQATAQIRAAQVIIEQTIANQHLVERIAELEARLAEREQEQQDLLKFDARKLTREQLQLLRGIHADIATREGQNGIATGA